MTAAAVDISMMSRVRPRSSATIVGRTKTARVSTAHAAGIHTHGYTPPPGNVTQASTIASAVAVGVQACLRGVRSDVVVLVLVAVVPRVIVLVSDDVNAIEDGAQHTRAA